METTILIIATTIVLGVFLKFLNKFLIYKNRKMLYDNHNVWSEEFEKFKLLAYQKIYRENILTYSTSGIKTNNNNISKLEKEYMNMVFKYCGPTLFKDISSFYGSVETVFLVLSSEFVIKIFQDEQEFMKLNNKGDI